MLDSILQHVCTFVFGAFSATQCAMLHTRRAGREFGSFRKAEGIAGPTLLAAQNVANADVDVGRPARSSSFPSCTGPSTPTTPSTTALHVHISQKTGLLPPRLPLATPTASCHSLPPPTGSYLQRSTTRAPQQSCRKRCQTRRAGPGRMQMGTASPSALRGLRGPLVAWKPHRGEARRAARSESPQFHCFPHGRVHLMQMRTRGKAQLWHVQKSIYGRTMGVVGTMNA